MAKKLFVGGLSWETTDSDLKKAFSVYGEVTEAKVITDRDTGRSRGFGFVTFARDEDAKTAISKMHGMSLDGRTSRLMRLRRRVHEGEFAAPDGIAIRSNGKKGFGLGDIVSRDLNLFLKISFVFQNWSVFQRGLGGAALFSE